ncbi:MAG: phosphatidylserine decarboxylase [Defluviitaleaceae bacterium]|nr:phosphatidylserine decarboxylase [Defluviitaleaceae bacterium]
MIYDNGALRPEKIVAEKWMRLIYDDASGANAAHEADALCGTQAPFAPSSLARLTSRKILSRLYGAYCKTRHSANMIGKFIAENHVDMAGCPPAGSYKNFAEFFSREKKGITFPKEPHLLGSPCEGLVSAYDDIDPARMVAAKGMEYSLAELFGDAEMAEAYRGGSCLRVRLTPADYHRMHFFDHGEITAVECIDGDLYSVNPLAVARIAKLYCQNKRVRINISTRNFGDVVIMEVGATFVGSIVHRFLAGDNARRGWQASYFLPGGSLVLVYFKKDAVKLDAEIIDRTKKGIETKTAVGTSVGESLTR